MTSKRVVVTGASSGIGQATVKLFRRSGWDVVGVARRREKLEALAAETGADVFVADLTRQSDVDSLRDYLGESGAVHALVNNAGGAMGKESVWESSAEDWQWMFDINVLAPKRVISALLPQLRSAAEQDGHADIVFITSIAGHSAYPGGGGYNAAKFAEHAMAEVLRQELNGEPLRVIEIAPGQVHTEEFSLVRFKGDQGKADAVYEGVVNPLSAEDIAEVIVNSVEQAAHVNIDLLVVKPVAQAAPQRLHRGELRVAEH